MWCHWTVKSEARRFFSEIRFFRLFCESPVKIASAPLAIKNAIGNSVRSSSCGFSCKDWQRRNERKLFPIGAMEFRMVFLSIGRVTIFRMIFCTQLAIAFIIGNWVHNCPLVNKMAQILQKKSPCLSLSLRPIEWYHFQPDPSRWQYL